MSCSFDWLPSAFSATSLLMFSRMATTKVIQESCHKLFRHRCLANARQIRLSFTKQCRYNMNKIQEKLIEMKGRGRNRPYCRRFSKTVHRDRIRRNPRSQDFHSRKDCCRSRCNGLLAERNAVSIGQKKTPDLLELASVWGCYAI